LVGLGGHHVPTLARERIARLSSGPAANITDTLIHPTITNETSPHFAEALGADLVHGGVLGQGDDTAGQFDVECDEKSVQIGHHEGLHGQRM
jgi:hypothetical protein